MSNRNCPVCDCSRYGLLYTTPSRQVIVACSDCGMCYALNTPVADYENRSTYGCVEVDREQQAHYKQIVSNLWVRGRVQKNSVILDVGCGTGGLIKSFIAAGFVSVAGISVSPAEVKICRDQGLSACTVEDFDDSITWRADCITASHVLEHVSAVPQFLSNLRRWLKPDGEVYIEVPDATRYHLHDSICQGFNSEHINHFSVDHLNKAMIRAGFIVKQAGTYTTIAGGKPYSCAWILASPWKIDDSLKVNIASYAAILDSQLSTLRDRIEQRLEGIKDIVLWGMGQTAMILLDSNIIDKKTVIAAIDTNPIYHDQIINGIFVYSPEKFPGNSKLPILVCSEIHGKAIAAKISELGLPNPVITLEPN